MSTGSASGSANDARLAIRPAPKIDPVAADHHVGAARLLARSVVDGASPDQSALCHALYVNATRGREYDLGHTSARDRHATV
jgi:hypothetical protein